MKRSAGSLPVILVCATLLAMAGCKVAARPGQIDPESFAIDSDQPLALVAFVGDRDVDSQTMRQVIQQVQPHLQPEVICRVIRADVSPGWAKAHQLESLPVTALFHRGQEVQRWVGPRDRHFLTAWCNQAQRRFDPTGPVAITSLPPIGGAQDEAVVSAEPTSDVVHD
ncbi:MAG: hypothetical protein ACLFUJ_07275 [Phycisphaerae bacterium]